MDDDLMELDQVRLNELRDARAKLSEEFVETEVPDWLRLHEYHGDELRFSDAVKQALAGRDVGHLLDIANRHRPHAEDCRATRRQRCRH